MSLSAFGEKDIKDEGRRVDERQRRGGKRKSRTLDKTGTGKRSRAVSRGFGVYKQRRDESMSHGRCCDARGYNEAVQMNDCVSSTKTPFQQKRGDQFVTSA